MEPSPIEAVFAVPELLAHVLGFLDLGAVSAARRTCHAWNAAKFRVQCGPADHKRVEDRVYQLVIDGGEIKLKATLAQVDLRATTRNMLAVAARYGRLEIAQWLADHLGSTAGDARKAHNHALRTACGRGHLEIAQWLASRFKLTPDDARANNNCMLHRACVSRHLRTAQWLVDHFKLAIDDARSSGVLYWACANDDLAMVQWLTGRFEFTVADVQHAVQWTMSTVRLSSKLETVRWLKTRFRLR